MILKKVYNNISYLYSKLYLSVYSAVLAQSVERKAFNLVVGGSSPPVGVYFFFIFIALNIHIICRLSVWST